VSAKRQGGGVPNKKLKYQLAREKLRYEYVAIVERTNCTDKRNGHQYEWIFKNHKEYKAIRKEHPKLYVALCRCIKCGKVTSSS
jgi:hypothetical protein